MLARKQGGWRDHCNLLSVHRRDEGSSQRDFRLAEADIAADQPIHGFAAFQIAQDVFDRAFLIIGFFPWEAIEELIV